MRRIVALTSLFLCMSALAVPGQGLQAGSPEPALTINYTQRHVYPERAIKTLIQHVNAVDPQAFYDIVGYETTPKDEKNPVSKRVKEVESLLVANGVGKDRIYLLIRPASQPYQKIDIFVRN